MKRLVIIVEGDAEESFINNVLSPYFNSIGIYNYIQCYKIKHSNGGLSKYSHLKKDIVNTLYENDVVVSTLVDFYRIPSDFPGYNESLSYDKHSDQVNYLESKIKEDIELTQNRVFENLVPYIQLHEFETFIFSDIMGVDALFDQSEYDRREFINITRQYENPEDINNGVNTAPSVRLKKIIKGYDKVLFGIEIIQNLGVDLIREKCPRFNSWIQNLIDILQS
ncbi:MAG: DUF4276 family protein [Alphaproteobacteria bacterium]|nr:DUF4276 family protein [Alphaproteobacteria bacterium]